MQRIPISFLFECEHFTCRSPSPLVQVATFYYESVNVMLANLVCLRPQKRRNLEKERAVLEKRHTLPETPMLLVHPSRSAKGGKFDATTMSLSVLLDYRQVR